jgi:ribonuclease HI
MRQFWDLPSEEAFLFRGTDWLLVLLSNSSQSARSRIIFLLWRVWHHRNNVVHGDGRASVSASVSFIRNYLDSFTSACGTVSDPKGKSPVCYAPVYSSEGLSVVNRWTAPAIGSLKANVDAAWDAASRRAGIGVVIRDHTGYTLLSEWKHLPWCSSAEEAEVLACIAGLHHLIGISCESTILGSDCLRTIEVMNNNLFDRSSSWSLYREGQELLKVFRSITVLKVDRGSNRVAHGLAQLGKKGDSETMLDSVPAALAGLVRKDCNRVDEP